MSPAQRSIPPSNAGPPGYGQAIGEVFGDLYGNLFAKDILWMFRNPTRAQRFPVPRLHPFAERKLLWEIAMIRYLLDPTGNLTVCY